MCGSFGIKGRTNSLRLFAPCHHPVPCAPLLRQAPNRRGSIVATASTPCSAHYGPGPTLLVVRLGGLQGHFTFEYFRPTPPAERVR